MRDDGEGRVVRALREMFPEIRDATLVRMDTVGHASGGDRIQHTWVVFGYGDPSVYYQTEYNTWCLRSPYTKIREVEKVTRTVTDYIPKSRQWRLHGDSENFRKKG